MVLEAGDHARAAAEVGLDRAVADQPRARLAHRAAGRRGPTPGQLLAAELVGVAEQLVAAADGEHHGAAVGRRVQRVALGLGHVVRPPRPGRGPGRRPCRRGRGRPGRAARPGSPRRARSRARATRSARAAPRCCRGRRRCSSARDRASRPSAPAYDHRAADVGRRSGGTSCRATGLQAVRRPPRARARPALSESSICVWRSSVSSPGGRHGLAQPLHRHAAGLRRGRPAGRLE